MNLYLLILFAGVLMMQQVFESFEVLVVPVPVV